MFEALERQAAPEGGPAAPPAPPTDADIERRRGEQEVQKINRILRDDPGRYWSSPQLQAAYRDAIERANAEPPPAPAEDPAAVPAVAPAEATPALAAEMKPEAA
jgi:hypothetical protein